MTQMPNVLPSVWVCPDENALEEAHIFLKCHTVKYILVQFVDLHGGIKSKSVPVHCLRDLSEDGAGFAGGAILGFDMQPNDPEFMVVADLATLTLLPWLPGYACVRGTGMVGGTPYPLDPRNVLAKQTMRLKERGLRFMTGLEPEFYLLKKDNEGRVVPFDSTDTLDKPTYDYQGITRNAAFLEGLYDALTVVGLDVYQIDHEDANGQFELNFKYDEALKSADSMQFFKMAAKEVANNLGAICSFLPKLSATTTGNGMHVHCSLVDDEGNYLFHDASDPSGMGLSKTAYQFIAGVIEHAPALTALLCPSVNSYKRLITGTPQSPSWAPVFIAYGDNNRSAMVRIPYGRIEVRIGDSSMNPYLATAAIIAAGLDGIDRELQAPSAHSVNFYDLSPRQVDELDVARLPENLNEALKALEADSILTDALGERLVASFLGMKRQEWNAYHCAVSEWEINRYLTFY
ncbi:type III glutamate--ammonia ligase [Halomonas alkaliantarctica]|uniref:Type III glutamate--ammonia ligase n=1 Tax=Halomonas alkaliantarctica TaxID=232346 RepID=A0ABY8LPS0_9GAMM|nr:type III glutamate--ammonia ligase [Halomonas alkaliantarctica]WGI26416.1 type III glutamate--ammonia ligase [Halomonas alkaliantarctica]